MRSLVVALASALLLAVVVTEFIQRLWPESYLALLIISALALFVNGLFNQRVGGSAPAATSPQGNRNRNRGSANQTRGGGQNRSKSGEKNAGKTTNSGRRSDSGTKPSKDAEQTAKPAAVPAGPRETGEVKWFNRSKGFGFIIRDSGDEIFVHQRSIRGGGDDGRGRPVLRDGEPVEFVVTEHDKGLQAEDVVPTNRA